MKLTSKLEISNWGIGAAFWLEKAISFDSVPCSKRCANYLFMPQTMHRSWKISAAIYTMLICSSLTLAAQNSSMLTGRFAARIPGPVLTSFGTNHEFYVFEITSTPSPQFVVLSYAFLLYEARLPDVLDYSHLYTFNAEPSEQCGGSIEEISRRYLFDERGTFAGVRSEIEYSKNTPALNLPWKTRLPCYLLDWQTVSLLFSEY